MEHEEVKLLKGNEALAFAAIRYGCDGFFGYPITPQTEIMETLMDESARGNTDMVVLQSESEVAAINMVYGGAACGKCVMTSSSGPGISLKQEGISFLAGANLPCLIVNVMRGGPGLGTIQPSQADYFQAVKGGGHGDYKIFTMAPSSVQEMADFVAIAFDWAMKYRNPAMIIADGAIGQMMEKVTLPPFRKRKTDEQIAVDSPWAATGDCSLRKRNIISSIELDALVMEQYNLDRQARYRETEQNEVRYESVACDDAEYLLVAFGTSARICAKTVELARAEGVKLGLIRPITLWPFPTAEICRIGAKVKGVLVVELNAGQMIEDVRLAIGGSTPVLHHGRMGGAVFAPEEVYEAVKENFLQEKNIDA